MPELLPLSDLRDPVGFLKGARIPLHDTSSYPMRREWCVDTCVLRLVSDEAWVACGLTPHLALDLSDPDVARWCDRKIAEIVIARMRRTCAPMVSAVLGISRKAWVVTTLHEDWRCFSWDFYREESLALRTLDAVPAHIPTARAALVRHLFGKETP